MKDVMNSMGLGANNREFGPADYIKITIFGFAVSALWGSLHTIILQVRLLDMVAESQKNTYLGLLTGTGLILAIIVQPIAGAISDRYGEPGRSYRSTGSRHQSRGGVVVCGQEPV